jgi:hypothetical protein
LQQAAGTMEIEIGGAAANTQYDVVNVSGIAKMSGLLQLSLINGFVPTPAQTFSVLSSSSIQGAFSNVANGQRIGTIDGSGSFLVNYGAGSAFNVNQIILSEYQAVALPGDYTHNGIVDAADYVVWRKGLGTTYTQNDYNVWRAHFGQTAGSGSGSGAAANFAVPEPSTLVLLLLAAAGWSLRRSPSAHKIPIPRQRVRLVINRPL